jgi:hypothetical protein
MRLWLAPAEAIIDIPTPKTLIIANQKIFVAANPNRNNVAIKTEITLTRASPSVFPLTAKQIPSNSDPKPNEPAKNAFATFLIARAVEHTGITMPALIGIKYERHFFIFSAVEHIGRADRGANTTTITIDVKDRWHICLPISNRNRFIFPLMNYERLTVNHLDFNQMVKGAIYRSQRV